MVEDVSPDKIIQHVVEELNSQHQGQVLEKEEAREEPKQTTSENPATHPHKEAVEAK
ncbi:hypothetical protein A2U01_0082682, partial [Trifolium medium]|nr:hypothetical protein [Trifolium medium]